MFNLHLPAFINPRKLCDAQQEIKGQVNLAKLPGLCSYLLSDAGNIQVQLQFQRSHTSHLVVIGQVDADGVKMTCQRCLKPITLQLKAKVNLAIASLEQQAAELPVEYDPWIVNGERMELVELIDNELMLNLPIIAYHPDCEIQAEYGDKIELKAYTQATPFGVLAHFLLKD